MVVIYFSSTRMESWLGVFQARRANGPTFAYWLSYYDLNVTPFLDETEITQILINCFFWWKSNIHFHSLLTTAIWKLDVWRLKMWEISFSSGFNWRTVVDTGHCPGCRNSHWLVKSRSGKLASIQNRETQQIQIWSCESMRVGRVSTRKTQPGIWDLEYSGVQIWRWGVKRVTRFSRSGLSESMRVLTTRVTCMQNISKFSHYILFQVFWSFILLYCDILFVNNDFVEILKTEKKIFWVSSCLSTFWTKCDNKPIGFAINI